MSRRKLRATKAALQARGKLETEHPPIAYSVETIDRITAERDRALELLDKLETMLSQAGGHMSPTDQHTLREARAHLVDSGRRSSTVTLWIDRR